MSSSAERALDHILIIMLENQFRSDVLKNAYMADLAGQGIDMTNYFGVMHPSQTNYIASIAGELCGVTDDSPLSLPQRTLVDLLEERGVGWKAYMDGYVPEAARPNEVPKPQDAFPYVIKHNPFSSFQRIVENRKRWERVAGEDELWRDLAAGTLPEYAWFTPDMWNDGHYLAGTRKESKPRAPGLVDQASSWLQGFLGRMRFPGVDSILPPNTLVVVTFDEADFEAEFEKDSQSIYDGPNQIYTVLLGDHVSPAKESGSYNHYSLLRTIEKNFDLDSLHKNDTHSNWFQFLWNRRFCWGEPSATPIRAGGPVAGVGVDSVVHVIFEDSTRALKHVQWDGASWSEAADVDGSCAGPLALVGHGDSLTLFSAKADGGWDARQFSSQSGWVTSETTIDEPLAAMAAVSFADGKSVMLVWSTSEGSLRSRRCDDGVWADVERLSGLTSGSIELTVLGHSIYLIYQVAKGYMDVVSYNTADFNVVTPPPGPYGGPYDGTAHNTWSPSPFLVQHFSRAPLTGTERQGELRRPHRGGAPLVAAELDGVIHLVHPDENEHFPTTQTFSLSGLMTPKLRVSYEKFDAFRMNTSNGFGTLAQAGWTEQEPLHPGRLNGSRGVVLAGIKDAVILLTDPGDGKSLEMTIGQYR